MFLQGEDNHLVSGQDPIVSFIHSGEHGWAANALGHQQTSTSQFMSSEDIKLSWSMKRAGQAEVCPGAWLLPHCLSELVNSTTISAKSGTGRVTRWIWAITWLAVVPALRLPTCTHTDWNTGGELLLPINTDRFIWRKKVTGGTLAIHYSLKLW